MTFTACHPLSINGIRLDTLAYNIQSSTGLRGVPGRRASEVAIPGRHGVIDTLTDTFEPGLLVLRMRVRGQDVDGGGASWDDAKALLDANTDMMFHLFGVTGRLLEVTQHIGDGTDRVAHGKVLDPIRPDVLVEHRLADFTVSIQLSDPFWADPAPRLWMGVASAVARTEVVTTLTAATAPIEDAVFLLDGPAASGVRLADPARSAWVSLGRAITAAECWRVDSGAWESDIGAAGMAPDADEGESVVSVTAASGVRLLVLTPEVDPTSRDRVCRVALSGSGFGASTRVRVFARRRFL